MGLAVEQPDRNWGGKSLHAVPCFAKHALTGKEGAGDYKCEFLSADTFT